MYRLATPTPLSFKFTNSIPEQLGENQEKNLEIEIHSLWPEIRFTGRGLLNQPPTESSLQNIKKLLRNKTSPGT